MPVHHKTVNETRPNHLKNEANGSRSCGYLPIYQRFTPQRRGARVSHAALTASPLQTPLSC